MNRREREQEDRLREQRTTAVLKGLIQSAGGGSSDHGAMTGLGDDDHPQYLNNARGDARYALAAAPAAAVGAHEAAENPHPVYLTQAEADALYQAAGASSGLTASQVRSLQSIRF